MQTVGARLQSFAANRRGWNGIQLAKELGVSYETLRKWTTGETAPNRNRVKTICSVLEVSPDWVLLGTAEPAAAQPDLVVGGRGGLQEHVVPVDLRGRVPLISWVQAGDWNGANDHLHPGEADRWLECPAAHGPNTYALRVRGDSMTASYGRTYPEGCIVFVDPAKKSPVNGTRIIAKLDGSDEVTFKVFKEEDGQRWLAPLNPSHRPIYEPFRVLGTVIGKWEDE